MPPKARYFTGKSQTIVDRFSHRGGSYVTKVPKTELASREHDDPQQPEGEDTVKNGNSGGQVAQDSASYKVIRTQHRTSQDLKKGQRVAILPNNAPPEISPSVDIDTAKKFGGTLVHGMFYAKTSSRFAFNSVLKGESKNLDTWKRRLIRIVLEPIPQLQVYRAEKEPGNNVVAHEKLQWFPLRYLEVVQKDFLKEETPLEFETTDESTGKLGKEFKFGQLLLNLVFSNPDDPQKDTGTLVLCCTCVQERDAWHSWFANYIIHCELKDLHSGSCEKSELKLPDNFEYFPQMGVPQYINHFLRDPPKFATEKNVKDNMLQEITRDKPPNGGMLLLQVDADRFEKRKVSSTAEGKISFVSVASAFSKRRTLDLRDSMVEVDMEVTSTFFIAFRESRAKLVAEDGFYVRSDNRIELRALIPEEMEQFVKWFCLSKGSPQSKSDTFRYCDGRSTREEPTETQTVTSEKTTQVNEETSLENTESETSAGFRKLASISSSLEKKSYGPGDVDPTVLQAHPLLEEDEQGSDRLAGSLLDYCHVEITRKVGETTAITHPYDKRLFCLDAKWKNIHILGGLGLKEVALSAAAVAAWGIAGYSEIYGSSGFSLIFGEELTEPLEKRNPHYVVDVVPHCESSRNMILAKLYSWGVPFKYNISREDIMEEEFPNLHCVLCGVSRAADFPVCAATGRTHQEFLMADHSLGIDSLRPRRVRVPKGRMFRRKTETSLGEDLLGEVLEECQQLFARVQR